MRTGPTAPLSRGHRRQRSFLRTARLNAVGHASLAGACLLGGSVSALALAPTGWPLPVRAAVGPVAVVTALLAADRRKWARMETTFAFTDDVLAMRAVADQLVAQGLPVTLDVEDWGPRLRYRNRDAARVHAALNDLGITTY
jgi:hypothetical protein